ncbi:MAG: polymerase sigma factor, sigma-70 family, partial [Bacilli bacterium]|nr:polymerase sigma factor, sigma-70 family [Bacilli bacterium]
IGQDVPQRLINQLKFVAAAYLYSFRMIGLRYALENNRIILPENNEKSTIAMYMILE